MTLRWKFALALAFLGAAATIISGSVAYVTTSGRLSTSVDHSLTLASSILLRQLPPVVRPQPSGPGGGVVHPPQTRLPPPPDLLDLVVEQRLLPDGVIAYDSALFSLPVSSTDKSLARLGGPAVLRTVTADGDPYRVITVALGAGGAIQLGRDVAENDALLASLRLRLALIAAIVIVAAAVLGWLIAGRMTRSLTRLTGATEEYARAGSVSRPIATNGKDEIGRLGRAFSTMIAALGRSRAAQQQLIEDAGHELRTPLTSLRSNVALLRRHEDLPPSTRQQILLDIESELGELTALVGEVIQLGTDRHADEPVSRVAIDEVARGAVHRAESRFSCAITTDIEPWTIDGRASAFERAITNLIDNAVKFSPTGSPITLTVRSGSLSVCDGGPGIADADLSSIFDRFHRSPLTRSFPGSGLGLAIVKDVAERHGGRVFAMNNDGGGATVGFTIP